MKMTFMIGIMALLAWISFPDEAASQGSATLTQNIQDSTKYEVLIIDPRFDQWYLKNFTMAEDRSNEYYHARNLVAVANWNDCYYKGKYNDVIEDYIEYRPDIDYGIEVNRKLFWYFKFVKESYGIRLF